MDRYFSLLTLLMTLHANAHVNVQPIINGSWKVIERQCSNGMVPFDGYDLRQDTMIYSFSEKKYSFELTINSRKLIGDRALCVGEYKGDLVVVPYPQRATDGFILKKSQNFVGLVCPEIPDREFGVVGTESENSIFLTYPAPEICFGADHDLVLTLDRLPK